MSDWLTPAAIVQTMIASALLMMVVLVARRAVMRHFGPHLAYALWLLPALRLLLPPLPGWRALAVPVLSLRPDHSTVGLLDPASAVRLAQSDAPPIALLQLPPLPSAPALAAPMPIDWTAIALAAWLGGAAIFFAWQMLRYHFFLKRALRGAGVLSRECGIDVLVSAGVSGPVAAGIVRRRILLPIDFLSRYSSDERRLALKHEAAHHDRLDIVANLAALGVVALHWWNPLAYRAYRAFRADQELACDATVLGRAEGDERQVYGRAVLKSASGRMPVMACALSHKDQLKQRIRMMAQQPHGGRRLLAGTALALSIGCGGLLLTAAGQARAAADMQAPDVPAAFAQHASEAANRQAEREALDAERIAREAGEKARVAGRRAAEAGRHAAEAARIAARETERSHSETRVANVDRAQINRLVKSSMDSARAELVATCHSQGVTMPADADFATLATCGNHLRETIHASLTAARAEIARSRDLDDAARAEALAGIDRAIADTDRRLRHD